MSKNSLPEDLIKSLDKGQLGPFYLFYGPDEFRIERMIDTIRKRFTLESAGDFNIEILYGDETKPDDIISRACSLPFFAKRRLIIVRRTERFSAEAIDRFVSYLKAPTDSTSLIFISSKVDSRKRFYKTIKASGNAVEFRELKESQVVPWIKRTAEEMGLHIDGQACAYLHQVVGKGLRDLFAELEKLNIRYGGKSIGIDEVKTLVIQSRMYNIFELVNVVSEKKSIESLKVLKRFLEGEDERAGALRIIGMLNRQIRLLWLTKALLEKGGRVHDVMRKLGLSNYSAQSFVRQSRNWAFNELENGFRLLYRVDGLLKSGSRPRPTLENLVLTLCGI
ncbi:MAG: DNA polymerase III subunit delta [Deltaproteobacteria bacterium]|nr:DNA polymerase III subunit delta [Deltaproteobacteria bacterium]